MQAYDSGKLVVMEAAFSPATGNTIQLYAVTGVNHAPNVADVANLSNAPATVMPKTLVADVTKCPSLGAPGKEHQANPVLDNYEGMTIKALWRHHIFAVTLISDDNFSATQTTRVLNLAAVLP